MCIRDRFNILSFGSQLRKSGTVSLANGIVDRRSSVGTLFDTTANELTRYDETFNETVVDDLYNTSLSYGEDMPPTRSIHDLNNEILISLNKPVQQIDSFINKDPKNFNNVFNRDGATNEDIADGAIRKVSVEERRASINPMAVSYTHLDVYKRQISYIAEKIDNSDMLWKIIFALESSGKKYHKSHAFILWLRYLDSGLAHYEVYQNIVKTERYWKVLQSGLISDSHEFRKFCLSILQLSVKLINCSFENSIMSWDSTKSSLYLSEWARYCTLFEIMAIDTSLHQAEAGRRDITGLISPQSFIHPSWGFCLLSTGFKASMDSVRKFSLDLLLSIPDEHLHLIKYGLKFLEEVLSLIHI